MGRLRAIAAFLLMSATGLAHAQFSGTITAVSDYDFRGVSLSATDPALQGSIDWAHDSGLYVGAWGSNIDYGDGVDDDFELDLYAGFAGGAEGGLGWDAGIVFYTYPTGDDVEDYPEAYVGLTYNIVEFKQWYTNDYAGTDLDGLYSELNVTFELPAGFGLGLHAGYNYGDAFEDTEFVDYSVGVTYTLNHFDLSLKWVDNDLSDSDPLFTEDDVFNTEGRAILSVSTTFPWSSE